MPVTQAEKDTLKQFKRTYKDPKKAEQIYYSLRNKNKKFDHSQGGGFKDKARAKASWWANRLSKMPPNVKINLIEILKGNKNLSWWISRMDTFSNHCGHRH